MSYSCCQELLVLFIIKKSIDFSNQGDNIIKFETGIFLLKNWPTLLRFKN